MLMRTNAEECAQLGQIIATKLNAAIGPVFYYSYHLVVIPTAMKGEHFYDPEADQALVESLVSHWTTK